MKPILVLRSTLFYLGYGPLVALFSVLACSVGMLLPIRARQTLATTGNWLIDYWLRITCGVRIRVSGWENIPEGPFVVLSNHQSPWETFYLQRRLRPVSTILKRELLKVPFFGWGLAAVRPIAIDRSNPRQAMRGVMEQGKARLDDGMNVVVYPEGTRMSPGEVGKYARSGAALAVAAGVPIVPMAHNAGHCWPSKHFLKYPGTITLVVAPPLDTHGGDSKILTEEARAWITETQHRIG